ncbi:MAG: hypothetical protein P8R43_00700, partial [Planctomycetota bacterium]|nr:hypothetical protein [Planctomycetota bacterium]
MVRTAWREGTEFRLVRAGDVARLAPEVAASEDASDSLEDRALFTGPRRSALGASARPSPLSQEGVQPARYDDDRDAFRRTAEVEIERLRGELDELRRRGAEGQAAGVSSAAPMDLWSIQEPRGVPLGQRMGPFGPRRLVMFAAGLALGLSLGLVWERAPLGETVSLEADRGDTPVTPTQFADAGEPVSPPEEERAGAASPGTGLVASMDMSLSSGPDASAPEVVEGDPSPGPGAMLPLGLEEWLEGGRGAPLTPLDGTSLCAFGAGDLATPRARLALGGCWGKRAPGGVGVLATDRVQGVACCKHHAAVQRLKRVATTPRALAVAFGEADQAVRDGLVPPMLELRADRSALLLARALTGGWRASGFDGPVAGRSHQWRFAASDDGLLDSAERAERVEEASATVGARLVLRSWIERGEDGGYAPYRLV